MSLEVGLAGKQTEDLLSKILDSLGAMTSLSQQDNAPLFFARIATTVALPTNTYTAGVITASVNGALSSTYSDSVSLVVGDYFLVKNEVSKLKNGLYVVTSLGDGSNPWVLTRLTEYDSTSEIYPSQVDILEGTINGGSVFLQLTVDPTVGVSDIVYSAKSVTTTLPTNLSFIDTVTITVLPNSPTYTNGTDVNFPGLNATYVATTNGAFPTISGLAPFNGMKILVNNEVDQTKNGDYILTNKGSASSKWSLRRISYSSSLLYPKIWNALQGTYSGVFFKQNNASLVNLSIGTTGNITFTEDPYYQQTLVSGTTIKTINSTSLLGSGDIVTSVTIPQTQILYVDAQLGTDAASSTAGQIQNPYKTPEYVIANVVNTGTLSVTTVNASATITAASTTGIAVGQYLTGTGIPYNSVVVSFVANTSITISQPCTASATVTATWWTPYTLILTGNYTATASWFKAGFFIDASNAEINYGAITFYNVTACLVPIKVKLGVNKGTSASSKLAVIASTCDVFFDYGDGYSLSTDYAFQGQSSIYLTCRNLYVTGKYLDMRFGRLLYGSATSTLNWDGDGYGLLSGLTIYSTPYIKINSNITTPTNVYALSTNNSASSETVVNGNIVGQINMGATTYGLVSIYANISGANHSVGNNGTITRVNIYGNVTGNLATTSYTNVYGFVYGNITHTGVASAESCNIYGGINGSITVSSSTVKYFANQTGTHSSTYISVIINAGTFANSGIMNLTALSYTSTGKFINQQSGVINCYATTNVAAIMLLTQGSFINEGTIISPNTTEFNVFMTKSGGTLINTGRMYSATGLFINYNTNSSPAKDIVLGNTVSNANTYSGSDKSAGTIKKLSITSAASTSVDIYDGTNTVTITGTGGTVAAVIASMITAIQGSILQYQCIGNFNNVYLIFVGPQTAACTFTNLTNCTDGGTYSGGGGYAPNVLGGGTELKDTNFYYNY
jgi:hypothetical protein